MVASPAFGPAAQADALTRHDVRSSETRKVTAARPSFPVSTDLNRTQSRKSLRAVVSPPPPVVSPPPSGGEFGS